MFFNVALPALLGTNRISLSWSGASAALDARIFLRSTGNLFVSLWSSAENLCRTLLGRISCALGQSEGLEDCKVVIVVHREPPRTRDLTDHVDEPGFLHEDRIARQNLGIVQRLGSRAGRDLHMLWIVGMRQASDGDVSAGQRSKTAGEGNIVHQIVRAESRINARSF